MFEKFGEFDSVEELNRAAEGFKQEGDFESLYALAEENGIEKEDAKDYADGITEEFATLSMAAAGKLDAEDNKIQKEDIMTKMGMAVIFLVLRGMCMDETIQRAVLKKGKRAEKILEAMKKEAKKHAKSGMGISCGTDRQLKEIIRAYYLEPETEFKKKIEALYQ